MYELNQTIYINNEKRRCSHVGTRFFVDSDSLPGIPCSQHSLKAESVAHLNMGGRVFTSGNWYSLHPPKVVRLSERSWKWEKREVGNPSLKNIFTSSLFRANLVEEVNGEMKLTKMGVIFAEMKQKEYYE